MRWIALFCLVVALSSAADAGIRIKPKGAGLIPLPIKSLQAEVDIYGSFAVTRTVVTFKTARFDSSEADFTYAGPSNGVITYFAYWYQGEKVVARVVTREKAAFIYDSITSRGRDPALIEMIGSNVFRARIFPINWYEDLRIEVHQVEWLESDASGPGYTMPLASLQQFKAPFEALDVRVRVHPDADVTSISNNIGLPVTANGIHLQGTRYNPPDDLRVRLHRPSRPIHVTTWSARSGGSDGFFAAVVTPGISLKAPRIHLTGGGTYEVEAPPPGPLSPHQSICIVGRYRTPGPASLVVADGAVRHVVPIRLSGESVANNLATKLWAAARIARHTEQRNEKAATALSLRYTLPSRYTSWLAVPAEEWARFQEEQKALQFEARFQQAALRALHRVAMGEPLSTAGFDEARRRFKADGMHGEWIEDSIRDRIWQAARHAIVHELARNNERGARRIYNLSPDRQSLSWQVEDLMLENIARLRFYQDNPTAARRLEAAFPRWEHGPRQGLEASLEEPMRYVLRDAAETLGRMARGRREHSPEARTLRQRIERHRRHLRDDDYRWAASLGAGIDVLSESLVQERHNVPPDPQVLRELEAELQRLAQYLGVSVDPYITTAEQRWRRVRIAEVRDRIEESLQQGRSEPDLEREMVDLYTADNAGEYGQMRLERIKLRAAAQREADPQRRETLLAREETLRARMGDPLIQVHAPEDAAQVVAVLPWGEIKDLLWEPKARLWEARFDIPTWMSEGAYDIAITVVAADGTRTHTTMPFIVDLTPPEGRAVVRRVGDMLEVQWIGSDVKRASAILPWGSRIELVPGQPSLVAIPEPYRNSPVEVTLVGTDAAHNRTTIRQMEER